MTTTEKPGGSATRLAQLTKGRREYLPAQWPSNPKLGRPEPIPMKLQVLSDEDMQRAVEGAYERFRVLKVEYNAYTADFFEQEVQVQLLARACRDAETPDKAPFAVDADDLREHTAPWERAEVVAIWAPFQEERNPQPHQLTAEDRAAIEEAIKKKHLTSVKAFGLDWLASYMITSDNLPSI